MSPSKPSSVVAGSRTSRQSRHSSTSSRASSHDGSPTEITTLLPPNTSNVPSSPYVRKHDRKASVGGRSVSGRSTAGSIRTYGAVATPPTPGPVHQAPRVSKAGQRRVLTTLPIQLSFFVLVFLTFASLVLSLILFLNTAMDFSAISPPYRGSGFTEFWISAVGSWCGLGAVFFHSHPSYLFFITTLCTLLLHIPLISLILLSPYLNHRHLPLLVVPVALTALTLLFALLSNYLVRRARYLESQRIRRMLTDAAARERGANDESVSRALVGVQGKGVWGGFVAFWSGVIGLIAGLAAFIIISLLLVDMSISAYDASEPLPSPASQRWTVEPAGAPWPVLVHLACVDPPNNTYTERKGRPKPSPKLPTILYEPPSGVPGSLALLEAPLLPATENATNAGRWLFDLQKAGEVGKICVWDRPGYGYSQVLSGADLGSVADALWLALQAEHQTEGERFMMVGEGYGGLLTRVFASRHASQVHSMLHLDVQTASTYFAEHPNGRSAFTLLFHRVATRLLPSLLTPLSFKTRLPSVLLRRSSSLSRILASTHPAPSTENLNENLEKARLQETFGSHSHGSASFRILLESALRYPRDANAIVVSSQSRMDRDADWAEGQRSLAEEVTGEDGLVDWIKLKGAGHHICDSPRGRKVCEESVKRLLKLGS